MYNGYGYIIIILKKKSFPQTTKFHLFLHIDFIGRWKTIARNVDSIAVNESSAWYVSDGNIYVQFDLNGETPYSEKSIKVPCPEKISKIYCYENVSIRFPQY